MTKTIACLTLVVLLFAVTITVHKAVLKAMIPHKVLATQSKMRNIQIAYSSYVATYGVCPTRREGLFHNNNPKKIAFIDNYDGAFLDSWGNPLEWRWQKSGQLSLVSLGANQIPNEPNSANNDDYEYTLYDSVAVSQAQPNTNP